MAELNAIASNYNNLEIDLATGKRGKRAQYLENNLALLCGAESATAVNNCAAALVLILRHFTSGKNREVVISRGELIQIGGGFRIPDILESTGRLSTKSAPQTRLLSPTMKRPLTARPR